MTLCRLALERCYSGGRRQEDVAWSASTHLSERPENGLILGMMRRSFQSDLALLSPRPDLKNPESRLACLCSQTSIWMSQFTTTLFQKLQTRGLCCVERQRGVFRARFHSALFRRGQQERKNDESLGLVDCWTYFLPITWVSSGILLRQRQISHPRDEVLGQEHMTLPANDSRVNRKVVCG